MVQTTLNGTRYIDFERGTRCLEAICQANGWQGGTIHDAVRTVTMGSKYNVRRYGKETYYTRDVYANGIHIGYVTSWHSDHKELDNNPAILPELFTVRHA